jgi:AcrR family transcriptional regulator
MNALPKRRDAQATRSRILDSARRIFTVKGYEKAGLREICGEAGVDQALIKRYFGSKQKLFEEIFDTGDGMHALLSGPKETLGMELAAYWVNKTSENVAFDATSALLKSVGSTEVNGQLRHIVETQFINRLAKRLDGNDARQRAALIISHILGFDVLRRVLCVESLGTEYKADVIRSLAIQIQALVDHVEAD